MPEHTAINIRLDRIEKTVDDLLELNTSQTGWLASHSQVMGFMDTQASVNANIGDKLDKIIHGQSKVQTDIAVLKVKSSLWGGFAGIGGAIAIWLAKSGIDVTGIFK